MAKKKKAKKLVEAQMKPEQYRNYETTILDTPHPYADNYDDDDYDEDDDDYDEDILADMLLSEMDEWIKENDVERDWVDNFDETANLKYTYKCDTYPATISLQHPEVMDIVSMDLETIPDSAIEDVLRLPEDEVRNDLHQIILHELYRQTGKNSKELNDDTSNNCQCIGNAFMFLAKIGTIEETLPVVLEVLRQHDDFLQFNFGDFTTELVFPVIYALCKDKPSRLMDFMLEEGLDPYAKVLAIEYITAMGFHIPEVHQEVVDMTKTLFYEYRKDLPQSKICDGQVMAFVMDMATRVGAKELLPEIKELYATGTVYQGLMGSIKNIESYMASPACSTELPPTEPIDIRDNYEKVTRQ